MKFRHDSAAGLRTLFYLPLFCFSVISPVTAANELQVTAGSLQKLPLPNEFVEAGPNSSVIGETTTFSTQDASIREQHAKLLANNPANRIYVNVNGTLYPVQGKVIVGNEIVNLDDQTKSITQLNDGLNIARSNRLPKSDARFFEANGRSYAKQRHLLPVPVDQNYIFANQFKPNIDRLGSAPSPYILELLGASSEPEEKLLTRFSGWASFGAFYDTGAIGGSSLNVTTIRTGDDPAAGQTSFTSSDAFDEIPFSLLSDNQVMNVALPGFADQQAQFYVEANNHFKKDSLRLEHIFGRVWNYESISLAAGKTNSLFGTGGVEPATLTSSGTLIGTGNLDSNTRRQIRIQRSNDETGGWGWGVGIEDPFVQDTSFPAGSTPLTRWPSFASNITYKGENPVNKLQFSALVRSLGFQAVTGEEIFETGWGLSAYSRVALASDECRQRGLFLGIAGGEGVGQYIRGIPFSVAFDGTDLQALESVGAYIGFNNQFKTQSGWEIGGNIAYGYARTDTLPTLAAATNRELHQGWANLLVFPNSQVGIGLEYQYGLRETIGDGRGENNRFMIILALTSKKPENSSSGYYNQYGNRLPFSDGDLGVYESDYGPANRQAL